jgi:hypothetical protein
VGLGRASFHLEAVDGEVALDLVEHTRVVRVLGEDERRDDAAADGSHALDDEEPAPAADTVDTVEGEHARGDQAAERVAELLGDEEGGEALAELGLGVPRAEEVDDTGEEHGLGHAEEHAHREERLVVLHGGRARANASPEDDGGADVFISASSHATHRVPGAARAR